MNSMSINNGLQFEIICDSFYMQLILEQHGLNCMGSLMCKLKKYIRYFISRDAKGQL